MFKTFVINLDKDESRLRSMNQQLLAAGISYSRVPAIDGRLYEPSLSEYNKEIAVREGGHALLPGEIGCALSHARAIAQIVTEKIPYALILEDDVKVPSNFKEIIEKEIQRNKNWEYLLFDYPVVGMPFLRLWFLGIRINFYKRVGFWCKILFFVQHFFKALYIIPLSIFESLRNRFRALKPGPVNFLRPVYFAGAYVVTYEGAKKLFDLSTPIRYTADHLPNRARVLRGLRFKCYAPLIVRQQREVFGSSILNQTAEELKNIYK